MFKLKLFFRNGVVRDIEFDSAPLVFKVPTATSNESARYYSENDPQPLPEIPTFRCLYFDRKGGADNEFVYLERR